MDCLAGWTASAANDRKITIHFNASTPLRAWEGFVFNTMRRKRGVLWYMDFVRRDKRNYSANIRMDESNFRADRRSQS